MAEQDRLARIRERYADPKAMLYSSDATVAFAWTEDVPWLLDRIAELERERDDFRETIEHLTRVVNLMVAQRPDGDGMVHIRQMNWWDIEGLRERVVRAIGAPEARGVVPHRHPAEERAERAEAAIGVVLDQIDAYVAGHCGDDRERFCEDWGCHSVLEVVAPLRDVLKAQGDGDGTD